MQDLVNNIVSDVLKKIKDTSFIPIEASGRHIHLSQKDLDTLFGENYTLTKVKDLSQPGQYACKERVSITGPKGTLKNVVILGPVRKDTQIEVSLTDAKVLGIDAPIRQSGEVENTPGITITSEKASINTSSGVIVAKRHIHIEEKDKHKYNVEDGEILRLKFFLVDH